MAVVPPVQLGLKSLDNCWNRARWDQLDHTQGLRYEVIDGVLYVSTSPSLFHEWVVQQTMLSLHRQIQGLDLGWVWSSRAGVFMPGCDPVQPDIAVVLSSQREIMQDGHIVGVPALLAEVLSPSHPELDSRIKRDAYARAGVPEYWIIRPATRDIVVCSQPMPADGDFANSQLFANDTELTSPTLPVRLSVADIFAGAPDTTL